jgi:tRNA-modifying protein YgfZ
LRCSQHKGIQVLKCWFMGADDNERMNSMAPSPLEGARVLTDLALIRARGPDAATFLHGQLTNDVLKIGPDQARLAALCNAQGRMLGSFVVAWRPDTAALETVSPHPPGSLWLLGAADLHETLLKRLKMLVLRAKVTLDSPDDAHCVIGLAGDVAGQRLGDAVLALAPWQQCVVDGAAVVRLPNGGGVRRWVWVGPVQAAEACLSALPSLSAEVWRWLEVRSGVAPVVAATSGLFVPQMLNYEVTGGVDFRKGCYPGQEVVARSQYLGKLKRRAFLLNVASPAPCVPGTEIFWSQDPDQPAGVVAAAAINPEVGAQSLLAELKLAATGAGSLHLGAPDGVPLALDELPYVVPAPEAVSRP